MKREDAVEISNLAGHMLREVQEFLRSRYGLDWLHEPEQSPGIPGNVKKMLDSVTDLRAKIADKMLTLIDTPLPPMVVLRKVGSPTINRWYAKNVQIMARPHIGERISLDVVFRTAEVVDIEHVDGIPTMLVRLKPDYRAYKDNTLFEKICEDYSSRDWYVWTMLDCSPSGEDAMIHDKTEPPTTAAQ
jgi:hypothetical protein